MSLNNPLNMDERNKQIAGRVIAIMYFLTILALNVVVLYRQFVLGQTIHDMEDIAVILTVNSIFLVTALLYFGAVPLQNIKFKHLFLGYLGLVLLGSMFTYAKYNIFSDANLSWSQLFEKFYIVASICGLLLLFWGLFDYLGKRRTSKMLDSDD